MKIGDRVRLADHCPEISPTLRKRYGIVRGTILRFRRDGTCADVRFDHGPIHGYHVSFLTICDEEPFPYRSHRNMAEVIADEQRPEPA